MKLYGDGWDECEPPPEWSQDCLVVTDADDRNCLENVMSHLADALVNQRLCDEQLMIRSWQQLCPEHLRNDEQTNKIAEAFIASFNIWLLNALSALSDALPEQCQSHIIHTLRYNVALYFGCYPDDWEEEERFLREEEHAEFDSDTKPTPKILTRSVIFCESVVTTDNKMGNMIWRWAVDGNRTESLLRDTIARFLAGGFKPTKKKRKRTAQSREQKIADLKRTNDPTLVRLCDLVKRMRTCWTERRDEESTLNHMPQSMREHQATQCDENHCMTCHLLSMAKNIRSDVACSLMAEIAQEASELHVTALLGGVCTSTQKSVAQSHARNTSAMLSDVVVTMVNSV